MPHWTVSQFVELFLHNFYFHLHATNCVFLDLTVYDKWSTNTQLKKFDSLRKSELQPFLLSLIDTYNIVFSIQRCARKFRKIKNVQSILFYHRI